MLDCSNSTSDVGYWRETLVSNNIVFKKAYFGLIQEKYE